MKPWGRAIGAKRKTQRAPASPGLLSLLLVGAATICGACGSDDNVAGAAGNSGQATSGNANSSGQATGGLAGTSSNTSGSSSAGSAHAGAPPSGGAGSGGLNSNAGNSGGAGLDCEIVTCFRAVVCLDQCGGKVVSSGCCPCGEGTVDELTCRAAGGHGGG